MQSPNSLPCDIFHSSHGKVFLFFIILYYLALFLRTFPVSNQISWPLSLSAIKVEWASSDQLPRIRAVVVVTVEVGWLCHALWYHFFSKGKMAAPDFTAISVSKCDSTVTGPFFKQQPDRISKCCWSYVWSLLQSVNFGIIIIILFINRTQS